MLRAAALSRTHSMARRWSGTILPATTSGASRADAGDCFASHGHLSCLPSLINIGVQKAGTGELQVWLGVHPSVTVHGGEVHFFDRSEKRVVACNARHRGALRLRYARFLWHRHKLQPSSVRGKVLFEKTPAYFDQVQPQQVACAVPSARLLVMLRNPAERARSAYAMCQRELHANWCRLPLEVALRPMLVVCSRGENCTRASHRALHHAPHLRRMLVMGHYAVFLRRWLNAFDASQLRVLWLEQFKAEPFICMRAVESFAGLPAHPYHSIATRSVSGLYVVGPSKSIYEHQERRQVVLQESASKEALHRTMAKLHAYYAPWQRRLGALLNETNTSLLPGAWGLRPS